MNIQTIAAVCIKHGMIGAGRIFGLKRTIEVIVVGVLALLAVSPIWSSGVPSTITIQGRLSDAANVVVVDGVYAITFKIYSDSTGGSALWFETQPVQVTGGLFVAQLGQSTALPMDLFAAASEYYLGITVNLEPELPRVPLSSVAYSHQAKGADVATLAMDLTCAGCVSAGDIAADAVGASEIATGAVVGGKGGDIADHTIESADLATNSVGTSELADDAVTTAKIAPDAVTATQIAVDAVGSAEIANGAVTGAEIATNAVGVSEIVASAVGTSEVLDGSLTAVDIDDEPGVAGTRVTTGSLGNTVASIVSRTITLPSDGYVLVIATATVDMFHTNGTSDRAGFGVSPTNNGAFPDDAGKSLESPAVSPSGTYRQIVTVHGLFPAPSGSNTYYFLGVEWSGSVSISQPQLSIMYVPTAYGTVPPINNP